MLQVDELCAYLEKKDSGTIKDKDRRISYNNLSVKSGWRDIIAKNIQYPGDQTQMIDYPEEHLYTPKNPPNLESNRLFVYADFLKPGKHQYIVSYNNNVEESKPLPPKKDQNEFESEDSRSKTKSSVK